MTLTVTQQIARDIEFEIPQLTPEQLAKPEARAVLAYSLTQAGLYDRGEAERIVELLRREAVGEPIGESWKAYLSAHRELLAKWQALHDQRRAALDLFERAERSKEELARLKGLLAEEEGWLAEQKQAIEPAAILSAFDGFSATGTGRDGRKVMILGQGIAGAKEAIRFCKDLLIPRTRAALAACENELAEAETALNAQPATPNG